MDTTPGAHRFLDYLWREGCHLSGFSQTYREIREYILPQEVGDTEKTPTIHTFLSETVFLFPLVGLLFLHTCDVVDDIAWDYYPSSNSFIHQIVVF